MPVERSRSHVAGFDFIRPSLDCGAIDVPKLVESAFGDNPLQPVVDVVGRPDPPVIGTWTGCGETGRTNTTPSVAG